MGSLTGVTSTRSGWRDGLEVVELKYDPTFIDYSTILEAAAKFECTSKIFTHDDEQQKLAAKRVGNKAVRAKGRMRVAKDSDQKYYLRNTDLRHLPMTEIQATKINSALKMGGNKPLSLLSGRQRELYSRIKNASKAGPVATKALKSFIWPTDQSKLAEYNLKLSSTLDQIESLNRKR